MNDLAPISFRQPAPELPAMPPKEPVLSAHLARVLDECVNGHPDVRAPVSLPSFLRDDAETALARYTQLAQPADRRRILAWLVGVNMGMEQPLPNAEFTARATEITEAVADMPGGVFNAVTRKEGQMAWKFFPGVSRVCELLARSCAHIKARRNALAALLDTPAAQAERVPLTDADREAMVAKSHALLAELGAHRDQSTPRPRALHLTPEQLRAVYEKQAADHDKHNPLVANAARARLALLRAEREQPVPANDEVAW
jgi:hypothetical protein